MKSIILTVLLLLLQSCGGQAKWKNPEKVEDCYETSAGDYIAVGLSGYSSGLQGKNDNQGLDRLERRIDKCLEQLRHKESKKITSETIDKSTATTKRAQFKKEIIPTGHGWFCAVHNNYREVSSCYRTEEHCNKFREGMNYKECLFQPASACFTFRHILFDQYILSCHNTVKSCYTLVRFKEEEDKEDTDNVSNCYGVE